jgi:hypothetical protein
MFIVQWISLLIFHLIVGDMSSSSDKNTSRLECVGSAVKVHPKYPTPHTLSHILRSQPQLHWPSSNRPTSSSRTTPTNQLYGSYHPKTQFPHQSIHNGTVAGSPSLCFLISVSWQMEVIGSSWACMRSYGKFTQFSPIMSLLLTCRYY